MFRVLSVVQGLLYSPNCNGSAQVICCSTWPPTGSTPMTSMASMGTSYGTAFRKKGLGCRNLKGFGLRGSVEGLLGFQVYRGALRDESS